MLKGYFYNMHYQTDIDTLFVKKIFAEYTIQEHCFSNTYISLDVCHQNIYLKSLGLI